MDWVGCIRFWRCVLRDIMLAYSDYGVSTRYRKFIYYTWKKKEENRRFYAYKKEVKIPELKTSPVNVRENERI